VATFVITCSDTRTARSDEGGALAASLIEAAGHPLVGRKLVKDEPAEIRAAIAEAKDLGARAIVLTGGTGIGARDGTIEAVRAWFQQSGGKELPGFGELFRMLSFQEIGAAAMLSRATAGTFDGVIAFALPGSPKAVRLALEKLVIPELGHAVRELMR
jgi:molybdenum cofactor biosynthesis protein B